ncbi:Zps1p, partial [Ascoidea rubescens DSM 1968]
TPTFPTIHSSCNATERRKLEYMFKESLEVVAKGRNHILNEGNNYEVFKRWFGEDGDMFVVLGIFDYVLQGNKDGILFRCDDADGSCAKNPTWGGHHRTDPKYENETVICENFYRSRKTLLDICGSNTISEDGPANYASVDLVHRYFHVPSMSRGIVIEEDYDDLEEFAQNNGTYASRNVDNLLHYLADSYGHDIQEGGC